MKDAGLAYDAQVDVAIVGGGPAGLAAATTLKQNGVARVVVLEREPQAGGIPRHCGHPPFGMREFKRIMTGPQYATRLVSKALAAGVEIRVLTTVVEAREGGELLIATPTGVAILTAKRVILATGVRENPRSARLVSGVRVSGVMNTGALQSMVYLKHQRPFTHPVIIGSELVAVSAVMTCRHAGISPVAMIEENATLSARWPCELYPKLRGVTVTTGVRLLEIKGTTSVEGVVVEGGDGKPFTINCDGVLFTGDFLPEASLARCGHLQIDSGTGGPVVDQWGRTSDPVYFATGNLLRPVETAGWSWAEGVETGNWVAQDLTGSLPSATPFAKISLTDRRVSYVMPQKIVPSSDVKGMTNVQLRVSKHVRGNLLFEQNGSLIWSQQLNARPQRRLLVPLRKILAASTSGNVEVKVSEAPN